MHAAEIPFGEEVSPRFTRRLRGQSTAEYVLIAAIVGLVVIFAGPWIASAIRNQFNTLPNTVDSGTDGDNFISAEEKAYREAMKTVASNTRSSKIELEQVPSAMGVSALSAQNILLIFSL